MTPEEIAESHMPQRTFLEPPKEYEARILRQLKYELVRHYRTDLHLAELIAKWAGDAESARDRCHDLRHDDRVRYAHAGKADAIKECANELEAVLFRKEPA